MHRKECKMGYFEWEDHRVFKFTLTEPEPTPEAMWDFCHTFYEIADDYDGEFVTLFDATVGKWMSSADRIEFGKVSKEIDEKYIDRMKKNFTVIPNAIVMMLYKGVNLVSKPRIPQELFKSRVLADEAIAKYLASN